MRYSRFDERAGAYEVYEDALSRPVNGDLPIPSLPDDANGIGVASRLSGRELPRGARRVGMSWLPQGLIVASVRTGLGQDAEGAQRHVLLALGLLVVAAGLVWLVRPSSAGPGRARDNSGGGR